MSISTFLFLFFIFSTITSLVVEALKSILSDKENLSYNIMVLIVAMFVGCIGTFLFFFFSNQPITMENIVFAILMGLASSLGAMVGYDRVKDTINQIGRKG